MNHCIVERTTFPHWPDWETRYGGDGPVRSLPLHMASPPPVIEPPKPSRVTPKTVHISAPITAAVRLAAEPVLPLCPEDGEAHRWLVKGRNRVRCSKCKRTANKSAVPNLVVASGQRSRPLPADPAHFGVCTAPEGHFFHRWGKDRDGNISIRCVWCKRGGIGLE